MTSAVAQPGVAIVGFGWMGRVHARAIQALPSYVPDWSVRPRLVVACDPLPEVRDLAVSSFGFSRSTSDWAAAIAADDVDVVVVSAPTALHKEVVLAAIAAGKAVLCEKPVGETPEETAEIAAAASESEVITGSGYNYRWAPPVNELHRLINEERLGSVTHYRGSFFAGYGRDRLGALSWRYQRDHSRYGVLTDLMCHAVDMAIHLAGPIRRVTSVSHIFVEERPVPGGDGGGHYAHGTPDDPTGPVTNEDYVGALIELESGGRGVLEADRTMFGPQSRMAFEMSGTRGAAAWNLETMNEIDLYLPEETPGDGYMRLLSGERFPHHPLFVPGTGNGLGWEHLKMIEEYEFLTNVAAGDHHSPSLEDAAAVARVLGAMADSWESGQWVEVQPAPAR